MTRLVTAMEDDGSLERRPDPTDGRAVIIAATAAGEALLADERGGQLAPLVEAIGRLTDDDRSLLTSSTDLLDRLLRDVERA